MVKNNEKTQSEIQSSTPIIAEEQHSFWHRFCEFLSHTFNWHRTAQAVVIPFANLASVFEESTDSNNASSIYTVVHNINDYRTEFQVNSLDNKLNMEIEF